MTVVVGQLEDIKVFRNQNNERSLEQVTNTCSKKKID
jgi:hypothetical protein